MRRLRRLVGRLRRLLVGRLQLLSVVGRLRGLLETKRLQIHFGGCRLPWLGSADLTQPPIEILAFRIRSPLDRVAVRRTLADD